MIKTREMEKKIYYLKEAAQKINTSPSTLKRWLKQGKVREVQRDYNGWRIFSEEDIKEIIRFKSTIISSFD